MLEKLDEAVEGEKDIRISASECTCVHRDAMECLRMRNSRDPFSDDHDNHDECYCRCHESDVDIEEGSRT